MISFLGTWRYLKGVYQLYTTMTTSNIFFQRYRDVFPIELIDWKALTTAVGVHNYTRYPMIPWDRDVIASKEDNEKAYRKSNTVDLAEIVAKPH